MKQNYPTLTFLTGVFLVAGVLFMKVYAGSSVSAEAVASEQTSGSMLAIATGSPDASAPADVPKSVSTSATHTATGSASASKTSGSAPKTTPKKNTSGYTDGTYRAGVNYPTPAGMESMAISVTIANGTVTDAAVSNSEYDGTSARFQRAFASQYQSYVVGKSLSSLGLTRVAGASLTTEAFDYALGQVRSQAAA